MRYRDIILARALGKGKRGMAVGWPLMLGIAAGGGTETTITGVSPLLLAAALKKPLKSLTQYGLCTQADTPTPAASVPIMCNNGALTMVDDELPTGYKRLTGIRFDGDTWYETGEALTGADDVTMTLDNTASQGQNVFGSYNGTASGSKNFSLFIYGNGSSSGSYFRYGEQLLRPRFGTGERTITFGNGGTDGFATDATATPDTFETPANAYIGMLPNSTSPAYTGDILGNILVGTRLKWIPCERAADGVIGYYEAIKGNFIAPSGTGTPTSLGYDGTHYTLAVVGTDEVISVSGKNLYNAATRVDGYYLSSGGVPTAAEGSSYSAAIPVEYNKTYTFSGISSEEGNNKKRILFYRTDEATTALTSPDPAEVEGVGVPWTLTFTITNSNCKFIRASFNLNDTNVQIEEGSAKTAYAPYAEQTASAPDLFAVGDYADEAEIISGAVTRKVGVKVLDGTENWTRVAMATGNQFTYSVSVPSAQTPTISTHFDDAPDGATIYNQPNNSCRCGNTGLRIRCDTFSTKEEWTAYLAAQYAAGTPVIIIYALATETTEQTTAQPLHTTAGDNTITATANVSPIQFEAVYMKEGAA